MSNGHNTNKRRVYGRIAPLIMDFSRNNASRAFHAEELRQYVLALDPGIAPDSPGRILRELRLEGRLDYVVIDRRQSLYLFLPVKQQQGAQGATP